MDKKDRVTCYKTIGAFGDGTCNELLKVSHCKNCTVFKELASSFFNREIPDSFIDSWTNNIKSKKETEKRILLSAFLFRIGSEWLAIRSVSISKIVPYRKVHSLPGKDNSKLSGIVSVDGELLPVICIENQLSISGEEKISNSNFSNKTRMIIVDYSGYKFVFSVDEVKGIVKFDSDKAIMPPTSVTNNSETLTEKLFVSGGLDVALIGDDKLRHFCKRSLE